MLFDRVIKPAQTKGAEPFLFAPKNYCSVWFCLEYRKLKVLTRKGVYRILRMDNCIESLGEAPVFPLEDANSGYCQDGIENEA